MASPQLNSMGWLVDTELSCLSMSFLFADEFLALRERWVAKDWFGVYQPCKFTGQPWGPAEGLQPRCSILKELLPLWGWCCQAGASRWDQTKTTFAATKMTKMRCRASKKCIAVSICQNKCPSRLSIDVRGTYNPIIPSKYTPESFLYRIQTASGVQNGCFCRWRNCTQTFTPKSTAPYPILSNIQHQLGYRMICMKIWVDDWLQNLGKPQWFPTGGFWGLVGHSAITWE